MIGPRPKVFYSGFVAVNEKGYYLLPNAPQTVIDEFNQYLKDDEENKKNLEAYAKTLDKK
jgi:hypothetical protein